MKRADTVPPSNITITYDHMTGEVNLAMDEEISYAEALGMLEFAKTLLTTKWQQENVGRLEVAEEYDEEDWEDDEEWWNGDYE